MNLRFPNPNFLLPFFVFISMSLPLLAQVGINTTDPKAALDIESSDSGILIPRVALSNINTAAPVVAPEISELVYNTATAGSAPNNVSPGYYYWNGTKWVGLNTGDGGGNDNWELSGNAGTTPGTNFLGTTDAKDLYFKTGGTTRLIIPSDKNQIYANTRGTRALPFYSFKDDPDTGIYSPGANAVDIATTGETRFRVGNNNFGQDFIRSYINHRFADGTPGYPAISFQGQPNMGLWNIGSHVMGFSANSKERMRVSDDGVSINGALLVREGPAFVLGNGVNTVDILYSPALPAPAEPFSQYRIVGPTAPFSIRGVTPLVNPGSPYLENRPNGYKITLINTTAHPLTILHNDASAASDQKIYCPGEANFVLTGRYATVTLQYNMTLEKWVIVDSAGSTAGDPGGEIPYGSNMKFVKGTTDTSMNSGNFTDMQDMTLTFTPKHNVVFVTFSASGHMDVNEPFPENAGAAFRLMNVTAGNRVEAGFATVATDFNSEGISYSAVITAWNASLNMFPVSVTPGVPTTLKVQWAREAVFYPQSLRCNVASDPSGNHRSLTILD